MKASGWRRKSPVMTASHSSTPAPRKAANLSLRSSLLAEARELKINISRAAEAGITKAIAEKRAAIWQKENREAIESSNTYMEKHGLPPEKCRMF